MATAGYMNARRKYARPQAMLWADNPGTLQITTGNNIYYIPNGFEVNTRPQDINDVSLENQFLILSDDNREPIDFSIERIENRQRMINGRMRSYHIADKLKINTSWNMLPSRSYYTNPLYNTSGVATSVLTSIDHDNNNVTPNISIQSSGSPNYKDQQYTTDGGAGGVELLDWYNNHPGSFWVYLAYDNYKNFEKPVDDNNLASGTEYNQLSKYSEVVEVFFADFSYSVQKRGGSNYDFWNVSVSLEEV